MMGPLATYGWDVALANHVSLSCTLCDISLLYALPAPRLDAFAVGPQVRRIDGTMFPWCGLRFDTQTCEVMANYSR